MLHMGYSSPTVIALVYEFTLLYKKIDSIQWHTGGDMIVFVSESTRLVSFYFLVQSFILWTFVFFILLFYYFVSMKSTPFLLSHWGLWL